MSALLALCLSLALQQGAAPAPLATTIGPEPARAARDRALDYLVREQNANGSWGTRTIEGTPESFITVQGVFAWQYASNALACLALLEADATPQRRATLERGVAHLSSVVLPVRGDDWDVDHVWAGVYGTVLFTALAQSEAFAGPAWRAKIDARGRELVALLEGMQTPFGGWGYYDDPTFSVRPKWATSFTTAAVVPALFVARDSLSWCSDPRTPERGAEYVLRCRLPTGAFQYDWQPLTRGGGEQIDNVKGSLGRIQVGNWALRHARDPATNDARLREGLESFLREHRFLDIARMRPIPHEAYYQNAGYFYFFGHYYAARVIALLPHAEAESWHARLRPHLIKTQRADGSASDFLASSYMVNASTAFLALALQAGLPPAKVNGR